jgi:hypothetical protein
MRAVNDSNVTMVLPCAPDEGRVSAILHRIGGWTLGLSPASAVAKNDCTFTSQGAASTGSNHPTSDTVELIRHATTLWQHIFRPGIHYIKCGVMLTELIATGTEQRDMLDDRDQERSQRLMTALDTINRRMGRNTVYYAGSGVKRDWAAFANMKRQAFTTQWRQMMEIKV